MWLFYKEKKYLIISLTVILLDGLITYYIPSYFNKINSLYPMLTVSLIPFLYTNNLKKYYYKILFLGIIYDLLYTDVFLYNVIIFLFIGIIDIKLLKYFSNSLILYFILMIINIFVYDSISFIFVLLTNYQLVNIFDLVYKIKNSLLLNIMSIFVYWFIFKKRGNIA